MAKDKAGEGSEFLEELRAMREMMGQLKGDNDRLREALDVETQAKETMRVRLAAINPGHMNPDSELMVGIRNVSDSTVGISVASLLPHSKPIQLHADLGRADPGRVAVITFAEWKQLRVSDFVRRGQVVRDDGVLGSAYRAAPSDRPEDLPPEAEGNAIADPKAWIESHADDAAVVRALEGVRQEESLLRLLRAVDEELRRLELSRPIAGNLSQDDLLKAQAKRAKWALANLGSRYRMVDMWIQARLEGEDGEETPVIHRIVKTIH